MRKPIATILITALATVALIALVAVGIATSGVVDVSADGDYLPGARWFFATTSSRSISRQAAAAVEAGEIVPPGEATPADLDNGAIHYRSMCETCHGGPGVERGEIGAGLKPSPPDLSHAGSEMSPEEIYWVLEHGIRHTGMPAYGATHTSEDLWALTAFVQGLGDMSSEEYARSGGGGDGGAEGSGHGSGGSGGGHDHSGHAH